MRNRFLGLFFMGSCFLCACSGSDFCETQIVKNENLILSEFSNMSILTLERKNYIVQLYNDSGYIQYSILLNIIGADTIVELDEPVRTFTYSRYNSEIFSSILGLSGEEIEVERRKIKSKIALMHRLAIDGITCEFSAQGVDMVVYTCGGKLSYVKDEAAVTNVEWKKYFRGSRQVDTHWYFGPL